MGDHPMVTAEYVIISWSHSQQANTATTTTTNNNNNNNNTRILPLTGFRLTGRPVGAAASSGGIVDNHGDSSDPIDMVVGVGMSRVVLDVSTLLLETDYVVTIRAVNLLGEGVGVDVPFRTPQMGMCVMLQEIND